MAQAKGLVNLCKKQSLCLKKSVAAAFILALSRGLGEVGITLILGGNIIGKTDTISLAIYNAVYDGRSDQALALSLVLVVLSFVLFFIINLLEKSRNQKK